jgi:hypothetical protein
VGTLRNLQIFDEENSFYDFADPEQTSIVYNVHFSAVNGQRIVTFGAPLNFYNDTMGDLQVEAV